MHTLFRHLTLATLLLTWQGAFSNTTVDKDKINHPIDNNELSTKNQLLYAEQKRYQAMIDGDTEALDRLLSDELVYVHSSGVRQTKAEHLKDIKNGRAKYFKIDILQHEPSTYDSIGLVQGVASFTAGEKDAPAFTLRYTAVYLWQNQHWQLLSFHCTRPVTQ